MKYAQENTKIYIGATAPNKKTVGFINSLNID